ncbi:MAG TPA: S8 family serine peptidase [Anaerolineae bacterium]|nr:S8 family serine peptidase [Anaerolineae bacterium]
MVRYIRGLGLIGVLLLLSGYRLPRASLPMAAPGQALIGLREGSGLPMAMTGAVQEAIPALGIWLLRVPPGKEAATVAELRRRPDVIFAELNDRVQAVAAFPNDPGWSQQWGMHKIAAAEAWAITRGTPEVIVAVVDSGTQLSHPDLQDGLWRNAAEIPDNGLDDDANGKVDDVWGWHFYQHWDGQTFIPMEDNAVADDYGHGTHVAGIVGARIDNEVGVAGVVGGVTVMIVKVLNQYGDGWASDVAQGMVYAVDNGARVVVLSLGASQPSEVMRAAVTYAQRQGVLVVAATGNTGGSVLYPAAEPYALAVAATDSRDARASFSNHGPAVDLAAPGVNIYSTGFHSDYLVKSGTSMAAPHVAGAAALIWSAYPHLSAAQVTHALTSTAQDVNGGTLLLPGWDEYLGWGRLDVAAALRAARRTVYPATLFLSIVTKNHPGNAPAAR